GRGLRRDDQRRRFCARRKGLVPRDDRYQTAHHCRCRQPDLRRACTNGVSGLNVEPTAAMPPPRSSDVRRLEVRQSSEEFQLTGKTIEAVRDVSFGVRRGEFVALLGPSGSGKSPVLNMIATLVRPSSGEILIDGKAVTTGKATPNVGYVFQRDTLFP